LYFLLWSTSCFSRKIVVNFALIKAAGGFHWGFIQLQEEFIFQKKKQKDVTFLTTHSLIGNTE